MIISLLDDNDGIVMNEVKDIDDKKMMQTIDLTKDDIIDANPCDNNEILLLAINNRNYINSHKASLSKYIINMYKYSKALNDIIHFKDDIANEHRNFSTESIQTLFELDIMIRNYKFHRRNDDDSDDDDSDDNDSDDNDSDDENIDKKKRKFPSIPCCSCCKKPGHNKLSCTLNPKRKNNRLLDIINGVSSKKKKKAKKKKRKKIVQKHSSSIVKNESKVQKCSSSIVKNESK